MKSEMYKYFDKEYHYLQKQDKLIGRANQDLQQGKPENPKLMDQLERTRSKLYLAEQESQYYQSNFLDHYNYQNKNKFRVLNPILQKIGQKEMTYHERMVSEYYPATRTLNNLNVPNTDNIKSSLISQQSQQKYSNEYLMTEPNEQLRDSNVLNQNIIQSNYSNNKVYNLREEPLRQSQTRDIRNSLQESFTKQKPIHQSYQQQDVHYDLKVNDFITERLNENVDDRFNKIYGTQERNSINIIPSKQTTINRQSTPQFNQGSTTTYTYPTQVQSNAQYNEYIGEPNIPLRNLPQSTSLQNSQKDTKNFSFKYPTLQQSDDFFRSLDRH